jgi:hypothetical protein
MNWSRANSDRINALFASPVFSSMDLFASETGSINLAVLNQLLLVLAPPKELPLGPVPTNEFAVVGTFPDQRTPQSPINSGSTLQNWSVFARNLTPLTPTAAFSQPR